MIMSKKNTKKKNNSKSTKTQNQSQQNKNLNKNQQSKNQQNNNQQNKNQQNKSQQNKNQQSKSQQSKSPQNKSPQNKSLKSVMNSMEKLNRENKIGNSSKVEKESGEKTVDSNFDTLMDFSKIDDEYKGELRRKLTPKERFFRTCEKFGDLFILNCLFTLTSIPIVTIGASFTAMYSVTFKMVRNEDVPIKDGYFKAFKRNFKQSTTLWVGLLVVFYLIYLQLKNVMSTTAKSGNFLVMVVGMQLMFLSFLIPLLFPMIARYENTNFNMLKNSLLASFLHLGTWATVFFLWMIPVMLYLLKPNLFFYTWYLWLVFLSAFVAYTCSFRLRNMFDKIEEDPVKKMIEDEQEQGRQQNE